MAAEWRHEVDISHNSVQSFHKSPDSLGSLVHHWAACGIAQSRHKMGSVVFLLGQIALCTGVFSACARYESLRSIGQRTSAKYMIIFIATFSSYNKKNIVLPEEGRYGQPKYLSNRKRFPCLNSLI